MVDLEFGGKSAVYAHHLAVPVRSLVPDPSKSPKPVDVDNLIIHGDNLHALKALRSRYAGRVDCIYIDPPYNTGNGGWVYNDNVGNPTMRKWLDDTREVDGEDLERHDKWLCMMWPRLQLLSELLSEDGAIFVSIDHNEVHHLRTMMDEIFGEENFRNMISVRRGVKNVQSQFEHADSLNAGWEAILFYSKSPDTRFLHMTKRLEVRRSGSWNSHWRGTDRPNLRYPLMGITPETGQWRWNEERSLAAIENYRKMTREIGEAPSGEEVEEWYFVQAPDKPDLLRMSASGKPEHYVAPTDRKIVSSLWTDLVANEQSKTVKQLACGFDNPKNTNLVKRIVEYVCGEKKDGIVLDSFAGTGTTAHAVLELNGEDGGNRKFILVECEGYADTVTAERVRRVIRGVPSAESKALRRGTGGSFLYCTLGEPIDVELALTGKSLPSYEDLASHLLYKAAGVPLGRRLRRKNKAGLFHSTDTTDYYLLYEPDLKYLRGNDAVLTEKRAKYIAKKIAGSDRGAVVFAAEQYLGRRMLADMNITFCRIPDEIV